MIIEISVTDTKELVRLLRVSAEIIDRYAYKASEADKVRLLRKHSKKLQKKLACITKEN